MDNQANKRQSIKKWCADVLTDKCEFCEAHFGLAVVNKKGDFVRVNQALADLYGVSMEDLLAGGPLSFSLLKQPDGQESKEKARAYIVQALSQGSVEFEWRHFYNGRDRQKPIDCLIKLTKISGPDEPRFLAYVSDISAKKREVLSREKEMQDQFDLQKLENLEHLAGGLAHDVNNASSAIIGNLEFVLAREELSKVVRDALLDINESATRITNMMRAVADYGRASVTSKEVFNLNVLLMDVKTLAKAVVPAGIELIFGLSDRPFFINGSKLQIKTAMLNLILNARDSLQGMPNQRIEVVLREGLYGKDGLDTGGRDFATITVFDQGCGIKEDLEDKIFRPYFTTKKMGQGRGLGLSQVQGIAKGHDGFINYESSHYGGTRFFLSLPIAEKKLAKPQAKPQKSGQRKCLIVDDEALVVSVLERLVSACGYDCVTAENGEQVLARLAEQKLDLLITDQNMPGITGLELVSKARREQPDMAIIICTGYSKEDIAAQDPEITILLKPFSLADIREAIGEALAKAGR